MQMKTRSRCMRRLLLRSAGVAFLRPPPADRLTCCTLIIPSSAMQSCTLSTNVHMSPWVVAAVGAAVATDWLSGRERWLISRQSGRRDQRSDAAGGQLRNHRKHQAETTSLRESGRLRERMTMRPSWAALTDARS